MNAKLIIMPTLSSEPIMYQITSMEDALELIVMKTLPKESNIVYQEYICLLTTTLTRSACK